MAPKTHDVDLSHGGRQNIRKVEKEVGLGTKRPDQHVYQKDDRNHRSKFHKRFHLALRWSLISLAAGIADLQKAARRSRSIPRTPFGGLESSSIVGLRC